MKPLIEPIQIEVLRESVKDGSPKQLFLKGISIQAEVVNGNRRKYPFMVAEAAVNRYMEERFNRNIATGELDHPETNISKINPDRISHKFVEINRDGNNYVTKARVLNTTCGLQVQNLVEGEITLGMSSRGFGKTKMANGVAVVENLYLVTMADIVVDPSAPDAWQQAVYENKEWVFENGVLVERDVQPIMDATKRALAEAPKADRDRIIVGLFKKYLDAIKCSHANQ